MLLKRNRNFNKTISDILVHPFLATFLFYTSGKHQKTKGYWCFQIQNWNIGQKWVNYEKKKKQDQLFRELLEFSRYFLIAFFQKEL